MNTEIPKKEGARNLFTGTIVFDRLGYSGIGDWAQSVVLKNMDTSNKINTSTSFQLDQTRHELGIKSDAWRKLEISH